MRAHAALLCLARLPIAFFLSAIHRPIQKFLSPQHDLPFVVDDVRNSNIVITHLLYSFNFAEPLDNEAADKERGECDAGLLRAQLSLFNQIIFYFCLGERLHYFCLRSG